MVQVRHSYDDAGVEFLRINRIDKNDLVITISSSGNSKNIINVIDHCNNNDINTLSLSGLKPDNLSYKISKFSIFVPAYTYGIVECCHQIMIHSILDMFMNIKEWDRESFQNMSSDNFKL
jgi:D-sedoheptulose 7-phosphate isomerase